MATHKQLQKIHILRRAAGVDECSRRESGPGCCAYHDKLRTLGVSSSRDLDNRGVDRLIGWLVSQGARDTTVRQTVAGSSWRNEIARRYDLLHDLCVALGDADGFATQAHRWGFNKRQCGQQWPQTSRHGQLVIEGQKQYEARLRAAAQAVLTLALAASVAGVRAEHLIEQVVTADVLCSAAAPACVAGD